MPRGYKPGISLVAPLVAMMLALASLESSSLVDVKRDGHEPHGSKTPSSIATALLQTVACRHGSGATAWLEGQREQSRTPKAYFR